MININPTVLDRDNLKQNTLSKDKVELKEKKRKKLAASVREQQAVLKVSPNWNIPPSEVSG